MRQMFRANFPKPAFNPASGGIALPPLFRSAPGQADDIVSHPRSSQRHAISGDDRTGPRIGFLFNAQTHQLLHGITTAEALARRWRARVDIVSASAEHLDLARRIAGVEGRSRLRFVQLGSRALHGLTHLTGSALPPKLLTLIDARRQLDRYDALALPERTSTIMRRFGVRRPKLIHVDHGAGDRAVGYDSRIAMFDFALVAGEKQRNRMVAEGLIRTDAHAIVGYPKFEAADRLRDPSWSPFADDKPVILYNPHFCGGLGSWQRDGVAIIDAILRDGRYNLVFAPHIRMCDNHRTRAAVRAALARYAGLRNLHVDLGSQRSIDMSYTTLADIYVGDVSSQIYEFLRHLRPALFVDSHGTDWQGDENYAHWRFGPVIRSGARVVEGIALAIASHCLHRHEQARAFARTFAIENGVSCSTRAADAIAGFMKADRNIMKEHPAVQRDAAMASSR